MHKLLIYFFSDCKLVFFLFCQYLLIAARAFPVFANVNQCNEGETFVEVKNVTLFREKKIAEFPDAVTSRGSKHLKTLIDAIKKGYKSYIIFLVQIQGIEYFKKAKDIDNEYYQNYLIAKKAGVNFLAYRCKISPKEIKVEKKKETQILKLYTMLLHKFGYGEKAG